ncbi:hypothetical protein FKW77_008311 [Venturia effusa]|uniref:Uncharacterized protein n=1 Tax=Venturia effusa TaxID=50376 RepID=A0A517LJB9_9PEZI|nr:hypothetical protein FKW77_008311 [Venturia effusa]
MANKKGSKKTSGTNGNAILHTMQDIKGLGLHQSEKSLSPPTSHNSNSWIDERKVPNEQKAAVKGDADWAASKSAYSGMPIRSDCGGRFAESTLTGMGTASCTPECGIFVFDITYREVVKDGDNEKARKKVLESAKAAVKNLQEAVKGQHENSIAHFSVSALGATTRIQSQERQFEAKTRVKITFKNIDNFQAATMVATEAASMDGVTISSIDWRLTEGRERLLEQARANAIKNATLIAHSHARKLFKLDYGLEDIAPVWCDERPYYTYSTIDCSRPEGPSGGISMQEIYFRPEDVQVSVNISCKFCFDKNKGRVVHEDEGEPNKVVKEVTEETGEFADDEKVTKKLKVLSCSR